MESSEQQKGPQMAAPALPKVELDYLREKLLALPQIECAAVERHGNLYNVIILIAEKDYDLESSIFAIERAAFASFPDSLFDFSIWIRQGRNWRDVISTDGLVVLRQPA